MKSHMLVGERRVQSTVDRYGLLIPFQAIAGLRFNILQTVLQEDCKQRTWKTPRDLYSLLPSRETGREFVSLNTTVPTR